MKTERSQPVLSKRAAHLLQRFDERAQTWGWIEGWTEVEGDSVRGAMADKAAYVRARRALEKFIASLEYEVECGGDEARKEEGWRW